MKKPDPVFDPLAGQPLASVRNEGRETIVFSAQELMAQISESGKTEITLLRDYAGEFFLFKVPTCVVDLGGHTVTSSFRSCIKITTLGTENTTTVVKNGTLLGALGANYAVLTDCGGLVLENLVCGTKNQSGVVGFNQKSGAWNDANRIENCLLMGWDFAAVAFSTTDDASRDIRVKIENSILLAAENGGSFPVTQRWFAKPEFEEGAPLYAGGSVVLGKNVHFLATEKLGAIDPAVDAEGEAVSYLGGGKALVAGDKTVTGLYHWATDAGKFSCGLAEILDNPVKKTPELVLPEIEMAETEENRVKAMEATALAYYNKNPYVQYDWIRLSRAGKPLGARYHAGIHRNAPEYASEDMTVYSVCAAYANMVGEQSFGFRLMGSPEKSVTKYLSAITPEQAEGTFVFQHTKTGDDAIDKPALEKARSLLRPGDVVTYTQPSGYGHTVIYISDADGDGLCDVIHCSDGGGGGRYSIESGQDKKEAPGGIRLNWLTGGDAEWFFFSEDCPVALHKQVRYSIVRPAAADPKKYPISDPAKTRILYPGLTITYTADCGFFGAVEKGKTLTYTLRLENKSAENHKGLKVQIPCPENAEIVKADGKTFGENLVVWDVDIPAGGSVLHTVTVKATGEIGEKILSCGYVHTISLPVMYTAIASRLPAPMDGETAWNTARIPKFEDVLSAGFDIFEEDVTYYERKKNSTDPLEKILVTDYYGGLNIREDVHSSRRVLETRLKDILPGDVLFVQKHAGDASTAAAWVFDGKCYNTMENGVLVTKGAFDATKLHSYDFFCLTRPAQIP